MTIGIVVTLKVKPGKESEFEAIFRDLQVSVKANEPGARVIGFPKGIGERLEHYVAETGVDGVGLDWSVPLDQAKRLQSRVAVQGNLDPALLVAGGKAQDEAVDGILEALSGGRFIFNLGHGIRPETPPAHVAQLVERVKAYR